jgi:hypothetical protein
MMKKGKYMKLQKNKLKTIALIAGVASTLTMFSSSASAAWLVIDNPVNTSVQAVNTTLQQMAQVLKGSIDTNTAVAEMSVNQKNAALQEQDQRFRIALGQAEIAKADMAALPTLARCVELSKTAGTTRIMSGGGGGSRVGVPAVAAKIAAPLSNLNVANNVLSGKANTQTCSALDVKQGVTSCGSAGTYAGMDVDSTALMANMANKTTNEDPTQTSGSASNAPNNYTLDTAGQAAATQFIANAIGQPPLNLTAEQMKRSPTYKALYDLAINRVNTVRNALLSVVQWKFADPTSNSSTATIWQNSVKGDYQQVFPNLTAPTTPSEYELLRYLVYKPFVLPTDYSATSGDDAAHYLIKEMVLNNYLQFTMINKMDQLLTVQATSLAQQLSPVNQSTLSTEHAAATNTIAK